MINGTERKLEGLHSGLKLFANQVTLTLHGLGQAVNEAGIPSDGTLELVQKWGTDGEMSSVELGNPPFKEGCR